VTGPRLTPAREGRGDRPVLFDLCCKQGGAGMGYHRANFRVIGIDTEPQPRYPFEFVQADAIQVLEHLADRAEPWPGAPYPAAIHGSPPCKAFTRTGWSYHFGYHANHEDLLTPMRERLNATGLPWAIENVPGAPMRPDLKLCGCMFDLPELKRERWFEFWRPVFDLRAPCHHEKPVVSPRGNTHYKGETADWARAMNIDWMNAEGLSQAIPPAYTEYIGGILLAAIETGEAA
jgi:DNA (cytosine-5)-methyltransferase 1